MIDEKPAVSLLWGRIVSRVRRERVRVDMLSLFIRVGVFPGNMERHEDLPMAGRTKGVTRCRLGRGGMKRIKEMNE